MPNIAYHNWLATDNLSDCASNIAYWISQVPNSNQLAGGTKSATVAASAAINTTETVVVRIPLLPGVTLQPGTRVRAVLNGTCTDTAANASTFGIRAGILGTVADASVATAATPVSGTTGTSIPFQAVLDFTVQTLGAAGTCFGTLTVTTNALTGIIAATQSAVVTFTSSTLATTTATWLDITAVTAATTTTLTFQNCAIEIEP